MDEYSLPIASQMPGAIVFRIARWSIMLAAISFAWSCLGGIMFTQEMIQSINTVPPVSTGRIIGQGVFAAFMFFMVLGSIYLAIYIRRHKLIISSDRITEIGAFRRTTIHIDDVRTFKVLNPGSHVRIRTNTARLTIANPQGSFYSSRTFTEILQALRTIAPAEAHADMDAMLDRRAEREAKLKELRKLTYGERARLENKANPRTLPIACIVVALATAGFNVGHLYGIKILFSLGFMFGLPGSMTLIPISFIAIVRYRRWTDALVLIASTALTIHWLCILFP